MALSLRWRLALGVAATLLFTVVVIFVTLRFGLRSVLQADLDRELSGDLKEVSGQITAAGGIQRADLQEIVAAGLYVVVLRTTNGSVLASTPRLDTGAFVLSLSDLAQAQHGTITRQVATNGVTFRVLSGPLYLNGQVAGIVQVGEDAGHVQGFVDRLELILLAEGTAGAVLALGTGYWLARNALKPIEDVVEAASQIGETRLEHRIGARGKPRELQQLADTFDAMLDRLSDAFQQQRDFVQDVSHELRTPLTALRGNVDVLLMDNALDPGARATLERMSLELDRLIRLSSNLLYLAHAEAGRVVGRRPVELDTLCVEVYRLARDLRPGVRMHLGRHDQVRVVGDRDLIRQLCLNLVDNGLKYARDGGEVTLSVYADGSWARLVVADTGPGISSEDLPHIFERRYQSQTSPGRGAGGAGIGLAISNWIAKAHGGRIEVESESGKGSIFTVFLPAEQDAE